MIFYDIDSFMEKNNEVESIISITLSFLLWKVKHEEVSILCSR